MSSKSPVVCLSFLFGVITGIGIIFSLRYKRSNEKRKENLLDLIGKTPLVLIPSLSKETGCNVYAKCEFLNPCGSSKDRIAKEILLDAFKRKVLKPGDTVVEASSGSTGISLTRIAKSLGCSSLIVVPDDQSKEKINLLKTLGAQVELVKPASIVHPEHNVNVAKRRANEIPGGFFVDQFENPLNITAHLKTGEEIWEQTNGKIHAFVASAGTSGTIGGVAKYLKSKSPSIQIILADPQGSSLFNAIKHGILYAPEQSERTLRRHRVDTIVEGVGLDRMTENFKVTRNYIDDALKISDQEVVDYSRKLLLNDGYFVGSSSALNCAAAFQVAKKLGPGHTIVTVFCSSGDRETTKLYSSEYLETRHLDSHLQT